MPTFLFLTYFTLYADSGFIHITTNDPILSLFIFCQQYVWAKF